MNDSLKSVSTPTEKTRHKQRGADFGANNAPRPTLQQIKFDLKEFKKKTRRTAGRPINQDLKLDLLRDLAEKRYTFKRRISLTERRQQFTKNKKMKRKFRAPCYVCGLASEVRHHIIQLQHGGTNGWKNVIALCNLCHAKIHPWLDPNYEPGETLHEVAQAVESPSRVRTVGPSSEVVRYMKKKYGLDWQPRSVT